MSRKPSTPRVRLFQNFQQTPANNNCHQYSDTSPYDPSPASTFGNSISNSSFPVTPESGQQISSKDPTINLLRSLQNSQIDDDLFSPSETKQFPEYLDDHDYGVQHGQNREFKSCARKSYQIPPTKEINNSSPKILSPENVNRYEQIFQSPTWRNIKSCRNNQPNLIDDPFFDSKKSGGIPPQAQNEAQVQAEESIFHPRPDRLGLQLSPDTAQAMLPPNACVFVANLSQSRTDEQLEYSVTSVFQIFGDVYVKVRRDNKGMPFAFCQYENAQDAQRAITLGRGAPIDGRPCRTEVAKVNRSLYLSKITGEPISESEARTIVCRFGVLEKVWYCSPTEKEMFRLPEGIWGFREDGEYRLEQPKIPEEFPARFTSRASVFPSTLPIKAITNPSIKKASDQRLANFTSIFVGNIPLQSNEKEIRELFQTFGAIQKVEYIKKSSIYQNQVISFAFVQFRNQKEAFNTTEAIFMMYGIRLRVQKKGNFNPNFPRSHTPSISNIGLSDTQTNDNAMALIFQRGISFGIAQAANSSRIPNQIHRSVFGNNSPVISSNPGTFTTYPPALIANPGPQWMPYSHDISHPRLSHIGFMDGSLINNQAPEIQYSKSLNFRNATYEWPLRTSDRK